MNAKETLPFEGRDRFLKAAAILEMLSWEPSRRIVSYLIKHPQAAFSDLLVCSELDAAELRDLLDTLGKTNIVNHEESLIAGYYHLNQSRLARISALVASLA